MSQQKYKRAALLLTEFLEDMLNDAPNILQTDKDLHLNVESIKDTPFEQLRKEDKITLVLVLLKQLQPFLSSANLSVIPPATQSIKSPNSGKRNFGSNLNNSIRSGSGVGGSSGFIGAQTQR